MATRDENAAAAALLLLGGGAAGYAVGQFILAPRISPFTPETTRRITMPIPHLVTTTPNASTPSVTGPPLGAKPIDPYASTTAPVVAGPPPSAVPIDPYATPLGGMTTPVWSGPITSPSQLDRAAAAALGADLARVLTAEPTAPSRRPALASVPAGPITSPSQVPSAHGADNTRPPIELEIGPVQVLSPKPPVALPSSQLPRRFDALFNRYRGSMPIEYVRALVARESSFHASASAGSAIGLMQIIPVVLGDYNKRHGTTYQREHLVDPRINVAIGCELLRLIIASYRRFHPRILNLQENWDNARFVELLTFGWNAGYSEAGGVGRVARYLEAHGTTDITIERVHEVARAAGASKHLSNVAKVRWSKSVTALYLRERGASRTLRVATR